VITSNFMSGNPFCKERFISMQSFTKTFLLLSPTSGWQRLKTSGVVGLAVTTKCEVQWGCWKVIEIQWLAGSTMVDCISEISS